MKKLICMLLAVALLLPLAACGGNNTPVETAGTTLPSEATQPTEVTQPSEVTQPTQPTVAPKTITAGEVVDRIYQNDYFNLAYTLNDGYTFDSPQVLQQTNKLSTELSKANLQLELLIKPLMIMNAQNSSGESVNICIEKKTAYHTALGQQGYLLAAQALLSQQSATFGATVPASEIVTKTFCGVSTPILTYTLLYTDYNVSAYSCSIVLLDTDYLACITIVASSEARVNDIINNFSAIENTLQN